MDKFVVGVLFGSIGIGALSFGLWQKSIWAGIFMLMALLLQARRTHGS